MEEILDLVLAPRSKSQQRKCPSRERYRSTRAQPTPRKGKSRARLPSAQAQESTFERQKARLSTAEVKKGGESHSQDANLRCDCENGNCRRDCPTVRKSQLPLPYSNSTLLLPKVTVFEMGQRLHKIQKDHKSMARKWMKSLQKQNIEFPPSPPDSPEA
ncbi:hypothetical protein JCGZ_18114 [Jatropha curcas]|uniref:Uncharacterized protein n=1 Tax=Jatropha curcas TaxID=180498 RepID=A0A067K540_JATCU|nr:hypothetical protein JCGZ_18114 [Jatropha curcas]